jgi:hypothetical protein
MQSLRKNAGGIAYLFKGALTGDECARIIDICEKKGVSDQTIDQNKDVLLKQRRTKFEDYSLTERIYRKVKAKFEAQLKRNFIASDTMITYVVYNDGGECPLHRDSKVNNNIGKEEYITVIVYLNNFLGGKTYFKKDGSEKKHYVSAGAGDIMIFHGTKLPHGCDPVKGTKKILIFGIESTS